MNVIICDDQKDEIRKIERICLAGGVEKIHAYKSSTELCEMLMTEHPEIDLFVLDIEMPDMSGLEIKRVIEKLYVDTNIIFLTSHQEMMQEAFGKHVRGFLQKAEDEEKLMWFLEEIRKERSKEDEIVVCDNRNEQVLKKSQIIKIQANHVYTEVTILFFQNNDSDRYFEKKQIFRLSLSMWENLLKDDSFYRVGRSYIVNLAFVKRVSDEIILDSGEALRVPTRKIRQAKMIFNQYCEKKMRCVL